MAKLYYTHEFPNVGHDKIDAWRCKCGATWNQLDWTDGDGTWLCVPCGRFFMMSTKGMRCVSPMFEPIIPWAKKGVGTKQ